MLLHNSQNHRQYDGLPSHDIDLLMPVVNPNDIQSPLVRCYTLSIRQLSHHRTVDLFHSPVRYHLDRFLTRQLRNDKS